MSIWILAVVITAGAEPKLSAHRTEQACVAAGEQWLREANAVAKKLKRPPPKGWLCTPVEETPS